MLSFSGSLKVFLAVAACDMRKGFNGLHALVTERLGEDLKQGALFVFSNRRHTRLKIIYWDGTGIWVLTNRHASHCSHWFIKTSLSVSSLVWNHARSVWRCGRGAGLGVCPAAQPYDARYSRMDVRPDHLCRCSISRKAHD